MVLEYLAQLWCLALITSNVTAVPFLTLPAAMAVSFTRLSTIDANCWFSSRKWLTAFEVKNRPSPLCRAGSEVNFPFSNCTIAS